ncbi:hypothetical protein PENTCL1PPCAC_25592, partial [Pristionchus entomophagus]
SSPIVYLGDISYGVYLVHWPVAIMWKSYWDLQELPLKDILICLSITFLIFTLVHHTLEQMFITFSNWIASVNTHSILIDTDFLINGVIDDIFLKNVIRTGICRDISLDTGIESETEIPYCALPDRLYKMVRS